MKSIYPIENKFLYKGLKRFLYRNLESSYLKDFYKNVAYPPPTKGNALIYAGIGYMYMTPIEVLLYHRLRLEGYAVDYMVYGKDVQLNEVITLERIKTKGKDLFWNESVNDAENFLRAANVPFQNIEIIPENHPLLSGLDGNLNAILSFKHDGIDFGDMVLGVMYRFYKSLTLGENAATYALKFLQTTLSNYLQVKKLNEEKQYKLVGFSHGIYCTWSPVVEYCKQNKLRFVCYDRAKKAATANFNINQAAPDWSINSAWKRYENKTLNSTELHWVESYLSERELQKGDVYAYNFSEKEKDIQALRAKLHIRENAKVISIFTNLIWDAANVARDIAFKGALDCIYQTIDHYKGRTDIHILIRTHPAEKVLKTKEKYGSLVREKFNNQLPDNVSIIEPEMNINSFSVIEVSDVGVVNTSTVGLEFAMAEKPIILISETHYRNKGFTYDAESPAHYFECLDKVLREKKVLENQKALSYKYFYMMMHLYQKPMPMRFLNGNFNGYSFESFPEIKKDKAFEEIIEIIQNPEKMDFIVWE